MATVISIVTVVLGLGLVIFFHELGHFAVAKWCDVNVERFSIGFGPLLWRKKWGETEYALSLVPFGGYVKMLGQDDADPSQLSSEEIAEDPRSYTAKSVPQRMAIISAGVIMNVITGLLFFAVAFQVGVDVPPPEVGMVHVGMPAWEAGIEEGDRITSINGSAVQDYKDILRGTALSAGTLDIRGVRPDGTTFESSVTPDTAGTRRLIGVTQAQSLEVIDVPTLEPTWPGTPAANATPPFERGDKITAINGEPVSNMVEYDRALARHRSETIEFSVLRKPKKKDSAGDRLQATVAVDPLHFRTLGFSVDIGKIVAVQRDTPAAAAGFQTGDRIIRVDGQDVGTGIDALRLPDYFAERAGEEVSVTVSRTADAGGHAEQTFQVTPRDRAAWLQPPVFKESPLAIPALGLAYHLIPNVLAVEEGSPAAEAGIQPGDSISWIELVKSAGESEDSSDADSLKIEIGETNFAHAFWKLQEAGQRTVKITLENGPDSRTVSLTPQAVDDWYVPTDRGLRRYNAHIPLKADDFGEAMALAVTYTRDSMKDIYLTIRNLFGGRLSVKELHGPLGIAAIAYQQASAGLPPFLLFLGFLSINLAVLNFLPIPVLDGGHMVFLAWEAITRKRPSEKVLIAATYAGLAFVLSLMVLVIYLDISRFRSGGP